MSTPTRFRYACRGRERNSEEVLDAIIDRYDDVIVMPGLLYASTPWWSREVDPQQRNCLESEDGPPR